MHTFDPRPALLAGVLLGACGEPAPPSDATTDTEATTTAPTATHAPTTSTATSTAADTDDPSTAADTDTDASTGAPVDPTACWTDLPVGEQAFVTHAFTGGSEGIAFGADGLLRVTADDGVFRIDAAGQVEPFAAVPSPVGLAGLADGGFIVASFGQVMTPDGAVYRVDADGAASMLAVGIDDPNFITIAPDGSALVSDDFDTRVFRVTLTGEVSVALEVESPNGMAYSPDGAAFYVASTFTTDAQVTRFAVDAGGLPVPGTGLEIVHVGEGSTPDGLAVSEDNRVYIAANLGGAIYRVDGAASELQEPELVASLAYPASLAFGRGPAFDPCSLYVTQLAADGVVRVSVGVRGAALYD